MLRAHGLRPPSLPQRPGKRPCQSLANHLLSFAVVGPDAGSCLLSSKALMSLASALATGAGLAPHGPASMDIVADPFEVLIIHDGWCAGVDQNDLIPLLLAVFCHPVRVKNFHIAEPSAGPLLSDALNGFGHGDGVHAHLAGLSVPLVTRLAQAASSHFNACHDDALLGLVAQSPRPVQAGRPIDLLHGHILAPGLEPLLPQCAHVSFSRRGPGVTDILVKRLHSFSPIPVRPETGHIPVLEGKSADRR